MFDRRQLLAGGAGCALALASQSTRAVATPRIMYLRPANSLPRSMLDTHGNWIGFEIEAINAMLENTDAELGILDEFVNWSRALSMIECGSLAFLTSVSFREERTSFLDYIGIFDVEELVVMVLSVNADMRFDNIDDFTIPGSMTEIVQGAVFTPEFDERIKVDPAFAAHFVTAAGTAPDSRWDYLKASIERLRKERVTGVLTDWYSFNMISRDPKSFENLGFKTDDITGIPAGFAGRARTYLTASLKLDQSIRDTMRANYKKLRQNGEFDNMWRRYYFDRQLPPAA